ncbi:type IV toxin-antitoxin system AbiEi family antitoxin domain-containing protein [Gordonia alkaliphila]|uniref:DUF559 domain-containing protein n=1 Tax=Gordonia alkaliphila TaxID=1053547 RepID=A0ABP8Z5V6_9ACTN
MGDIGAVATELASHDGVITAQRAIACGLSRAQIQKRIRSGAWLRVARGVFRSAAHEYSEAALVRVAAAAHGGVADRTTAAWWHGLVDELATPLSVAGGDTESAAERVFVGAVQAERLTGWVLQHRFGRWRIDVAWPTERIAVEIDGWAFHRSVKEFDRDRAKRNALAAAGWIVLSFTWHQLTYELESCMRQLVEVVASRRAELG